MYVSFYDAIEELTTEEKGILLDTIFKYQAGTIIPELPKTVRIVFSIMAKQFDRDEIKYQEKVVTRNRINGKEGGRPRKNQDEPKKPKKPNGFINNPKNPDNDNVNDNDNETVNDNESEGKTKRFSPPSLSEIESCFSLKISEKKVRLNAKDEAEKFEAFYSSKNWMVGKNKMTNWKSAISGWIAKSEPTNKSNEHKSVNVSGNRPGQIYNAQRTPEEQAEFEAETQF